jgi:hypothetical protein
MHRTSLGRADTVIPDSSMRWWLDAAFDPTRRTRLIPGDRVVRPDERTITPEIKTF